MAAATPLRTDPLALPPVPPPAPDAHPRRDRFVVWAFVPCLAFALAGAVVKRDLELTAFENRRAAPWPDPASALRAFRSFPPAFEAAFADRFGARDKLIGLHHAITMELFGVSPVSNVMLGRDDWIYFLGEDGKSLDRDYRGVAPYPADEAVRVAAELERRRAFLARLGIAYVVMIVPDKHTIYPEYLPPWVVRGKGASRLDRFYAAMRAYPEVTVLDLRPALIAAKSRERLYYQTDSHWNYLGATIGYDALVAAIKPRVPAFPGVPAPRPPYVQGVDLYSGDLATLLGNRMIEEDDIAPLPKVLFRAAWGCAKPSERKPALAPAPPVETLVFECKRQGLPTALVYRDSMGIPLLPLLSENFRRVVYVSDRRLDPALVEAEKPDVVIEEMVERSIHAPAALPMR